MAPGFDTVTFFSSETMTEAEVERAKVSDVEIAYQPSPDSPRCAARALLVEYRETECGSMRKYRLTTPLKASARRKTSAKR